MNRITSVVFLVCILELYNTEFVSVDIEDTGTRRPIWNIAHMVNALYQIDLYLGEGANSLEFDVYFDSSGEAIYTYHGVPCDCFRTCTRYARITDYLEKLRHVTTPGDSKFRERMVLIFMDLKLSRLSSGAVYVAGTDIAKKLLDYYWLRGKGKAQAYVLLSIPSIAQRQFVTGFYDVLRNENFTQYISKTGVDFSGNEDLTEIQRTFDALNLKDRVWQSDGITNCLHRSTTRLRRALSIRDRSGAVIKKVYWWTVDRASTMRSVLSLGVDGLITNHPDRLRDVLRESEFSSKFRLATIHDNPWQTFSLGASLIKEPSGIMGRGGSITNEHVLPDEDEILYNCDVCSE